MKSMVSVMHQLRHIAAWLLLAAFALGGTLGPVVHHVQHAVEQTEATTEACHPDAVHNSEVALWTEPGSAADVPECDLCTRRVLVVPPALAPLAGPALMLTTQVATPSDVVPVHTTVDRFIRGPPSLLGDRLA